MSGQVCQLLNLIKLNYNIDTNLTTSDQVKMNLFRDLMFSLIYEQFHSDFANWTVFTTNK